MTRTFEAVVDEKGNLRLPEGAVVPAGSRALVTIVEETLPETALLSEKALAQDWNRGEEDEAWADLAPAP